MKSELKALVVLFGFMFGVMALAQKFYTHETIENYGYTPPPTPEDRQSLGEPDQSLKDVAPELFNDPQ